MEGKSVRFATLLEQHINKVVKKLYLNEQATSAVLHSIHATVRREIDNVFLKSNFKLTPESRSWLTDQMFKSISINGEESIGDRVITNEYKLETLPYHDIELLRNLFNETAIGPYLEEEYARRSQS